MNEPDPTGDPTAKPTTPPPDLAKYTPPVPTAAKAPVITPPAVDSPEEARRIHLKVAPDAVDKTTADGAIAPFNTRFLAGLIDIFLGVGLYSGCLWLLPSFIDSKLGFLLNVGYLLTRDCLPFLGGQSVGKKAMGLMTVTADGKSLVGNWQPGLIRNAVLLIPLFPLIEVFILLTREDKPERGRRLGDEWAATKVVIHKPEPPPEA